MSAEELALIESSRLAAHAERSQVPLRVARSALRKYSAFLRGCEPLEIRLLARVLSEASPVEIRSLLASVDS
jgi:hypothetical protein